MKPLNGYAVAIAKLNATQVKRLKLEAERMRVHTLLHYISSGFPLKARYVMLKLSRQVTAFVPRAYAMEFMVREGYLIKHHMLVGRSAAVYLPGNEKLTDKEIATAIQDYEYALLRGIIPNVLYVKQEMRHRKRGRPKGAKNKPKRMGL